MYLHNAVQVFRYYNTRFITITWVYRYINPCYCNKSCPYTSLLKAVPVLEGLIKVGDKLLPCLSVFDLSQGGTAALKRPVTAMT